MSVAVSVEVFVGVDSRVADFENVFVAIEIDLEVVIEFVSLKVEVFVAGSDREIVFVLDKDFVRLFVND